MTLVNEKIHKDLKIKAVDAYVKQLLQENLPASIFFHTYQHTQRVWKAVKELSRQAKVSTEDREILQIAALFHDTGFIKDYENHEKESIFLAVNYLRDKGYPEEKIAKIKALIEVTKLDIAPATFLQKLMCDADTAHLGQKRYRRRSERLRKEWEYFRKDYCPTDLEWEKENLKFLQQHNYYT
ncbi:MAG: HD domain-containing protein, partial [Bacteroidota bacterium]